MKRIDEKYDEIEEFKPWEFTNNIAYELTIRTKEYRDIKDHLEALIRIMKKDYEKINKKDAPNTTFSSKNISENTIEVSYKIDLDQAYITYLDTTSKRINSLSHLLLEGYKELGLNMLHELNDELNEFVYNAKILREHTINSLIKNTKILIDPITQQFNEVSDSLYLSFKRPTINFPTTPKAHISINPNMKKDELIEYVTEVINAHYKEQPKLICEADIFPELFGIKEHERQKENYKNKRFADLFFIYDYVKCKQQKSETYHAIVTLRDEIDALKSKINNQISADDINEYSYTNKELKEQIKMREKELEREEEDYFIKNILEEKYLQTQLDKTASYLVKEYKKINKLIRNYSSKKLI